MPRRFQFSLRAMLCSGTSLAVSCGMLRIALRRDKDWLDDPMGPALVVAAMSSAGVAIGCLVNRPIIGALVGLLFAAIPCLAVVAFEALMHMAFTGLRLDMKPEPL